MGFPMKLHRKRPVIFAFIFLMFFVLNISLLGNIYGAEIINKIITERTTFVVDQAGNAKVDRTWQYYPQRFYDRVKVTNPNLYTAVRDFGRPYYMINPESLKVTGNDQKRSINYQADLFGIATSHKNRWEVKLSEDENLVTLDNNKIFTTWSFFDSSRRETQIGIVAYVLPKEAQDVAFSKENHLITYTLPQPKSAAGDPNLSIIVDYKPQLMSSVYKIYSDPDAFGGRFWVARIVLKNNGTVPIYDLKFSYKLGDYTEINSPDRYSIVTPNGSVIDLFYPIISSKITELKTKTPAQLYVKYEYKDAAGRIYQEELTKRVEILGVNQFRWSDVKDEEMTDTWEDHFRNANLIAAFVCRMDDAVKQFAGYVSEASGGAAASSSDEAAWAWLKASYDLQLSNNIVYQTPSGYMTLNQGNVQDLKMPRDVFRDKAGTCIDLAITYAAVAEAVGLRTYLVLLPGHCFSVIELPKSKNYVAVENTGLSGGNKRLSFEQAVNLGIKEFQSLDEQPWSHIIDIEWMLTEGGVQNPELTSVGPDFLEKCGIKRMGSKSKPNQSGLQSTNWW